MENELKNPSRNYRSEKFVWSEFLAAWKTTFMPFRSGAEAFLHVAKIAKKLF